MQKNTWIRLGLGSVVAVATTCGITLSACSGDDTVTDDDATTDGYTPPTDSGPGDSGPDGGELAKLIMVHGSPDIPAVRICFSVGLAADLSDQQMSPLPPLPNQISGPLPYPGLFPGTGGVIPRTGTDISSVYIVPYIVSAAKLAALGFVPDAGAPKDCRDALVGDAGGLVEGTDYWKLPAIPAGTFTTDSTFLLAATGCLPNTTVAPSAKCGSDYMANTGNFRIRAFKLDRATPAAGMVSAQFAHASSPIQAVLMQGVRPAFFHADGGVTPITGQGGGDGGGGGGTVNFGELKPQTAAPAAVNPATDGFGVLYTGADGGTETMALPLSAIQNLTTGSATPSMFVNGQSYTFVALGDPQEPQFIDMTGDASTPDGGRFNGRSAHFLAFPNDPPVTPVTQ